MTDHVSAIIVNFNAGDLLGACVNSLLNCPNIEEIVVVDNASTDSSLHAVNQLSGVKVIRNSVNLGFASACNIGLKQVESEFVFFFNPDCSLAPEALGEILNCLKSDNAIGMAGGLLVNPDGSEQAGGRRAVPTPWRSFVRAFGLHRLETRWPRLFFDFDLHKHPLPATPIEVEAISGACMLVKRQAIESVGLWDEGYFLHCEDLDWCMRFRQKGWKIMFVPTAKIVHEQGACSRSRPVFVEWHKHKGMLRFYRKFFRHQYPSVLMWLVALGVWFRFAAVASYYTFRRFWHG
jgi:Predicted glycosyltransferases